MKNINKVIQKKKIINNIINNNNSYLIDKDKSSIKLKYNKKQ